MRFSSILTSIREALQQRQSPGTIVLRARTTNATPIEAFIDGQPGRRIVPSSSSGVLMRINGACFSSNNTAQTITGKVAYVVTAAGVITLNSAPVDLAATSATPGTSTGSAPVAQSNNISLAAGAGSITFTVIPATATSNAYIAVFVTGFASITTDWEIELSFVEAGPRG